MNKPTFLKILEYLEEHGVGNEVNISPILMDLFPLDPNRDLYEETYAVSSKVMATLYSMAEAGLLEFTPVGIGSYDHEAQARRWLDKHEQKALLKFAGITYMENNRASALQDRVSQSVIDTNEISKQSIASQQATTQMQSRILWLTLFVTVISAIVSVYSAVKDDSKRELQKELKELQMQNSKPRTSLYQTKKSLPIAPAAKNSPKKTP